MSSWLSRIFSGPKDQPHDDPPELTDVELRALRMQLKPRIVADIDPSIDLSKATEVRESLRRIFDRSLARLRLALIEEQADLLFEELVADIVGFGPIEPLLKDGSITRITVVGADQVYAEKTGDPSLTEVKFEGPDHVRRIVDKMAYTYGTQADRGTVFRGALPDGSAFAASTPPTSVGGPVLVIDKPPRVEPVVTAALLQLALLTPEQVAFLRDRPDSLLAPGL